MVDGDRARLQLAAARRLDSDRRLLAQWPTGLGKSGIAIRWMAEHPGHGPVLIAVPEANNVQNWRDEFTKAGVPDFGVTYTCYASLPKHSGTSWSLVVYDECPHLDTDIRTEAAAHIAADRVLALGALVSPDEAATLESLYGRFTTSRISLERAFRSGMLPRPKVRVLHLDLKGRAGEYASVDADVRAAREEYGRRGDVWSKNRLLAAGSRRKRFLGACKEEAMRRLASRLEAEGRRILFFCSSVRQAESLGGGRAFTSKTRRAMEVLDAFNSHRIDSLYAVGKLVEGQNLRDIDAGVLGQLDGAARLTVQKCGRILRSERPEIFVLVVDGTKDTSFLNTLTYNIPNDCIVHERETL